MTKVKYNSIKAAIKDMEANYKEDSKKLENLNPNQKANAEQVNKRKCYIEYFQF